MKAITAIVAAVALAAFAGTAGAQGFIDDFESYPTGVIGAPYSACCSLQVPFEVDAGIGFGGGQAAHHVTSGTWGEAKRSTGLTMTNPWTMSIMVFKDSADTGLSRIAGGIGTITGNQARYAYEFDAGNLWHGFSSDSGAGAFLISDTSFTLPDDQWHRLTVNGTPVVGGQTVQVDIEAWGGASWGAPVNLIASQMWNAPSFVGDEAWLSNIGQDLDTAQDNFIVSEIPEPATMALLGIGGLMVLRRRRAA